MRAIFVMIKTDPGYAYEVADKLAELETLSEVYSISGAFDLLAKLYVEDIKEFDDLGRLVVEQIQKLPHIRDTFTILTFRAFK